MTFFSDLSLDGYSSEPCINVGWLERGHEFETMSPSEETLDLLWSFCSFRVKQLLLCSRFGPPRWRKS
jgi:hypothetical protein